MLAVDVLVQRVEVAFCVLQEERRGSRLARLVTALQKRLMRSGILHVDAELLIPLVRDRRQMDDRRIAPLGCLGPGSSLQP